MEKYAEYMKVGWIIMLLIIADCYGKKKGILLKKNISISKKKIKKFKFQKNMQFLEKTNTLTMLTQK